MRLLSKLLVAAGLWGVIGLPALANDATAESTINAAGAAAFSIGPDGTVYGAAVAASVSEDTAFAESRNAAGVSAARAFGSSDIVLTPFGQWDAPTDENFSIDDVGGGLGIVSIVIDDGDVVIETAPIITEEDVAAAESAGFADGRPNDLEEIFNQAFKQRL